MITSKSINVLKCRKTEKQIYVHVWSFSCIEHMKTTLSMQRQLKGSNNVPSFFAMNRTYCTFFLWRLHLAPPSHLGQSTALLWLETPSSKCTKLPTVAPSNNEDPTSW